MKFQIEEANKKLTEIQKQLQNLTELLNGKRDSSGYPIPNDPGVVDQMEVVERQAGAN